jgi:hypothetical protein
MEYNMDAPKITILFLKVLQDLSPADGGCNTGTTVESANVKNEREINVRE